MKLFKEYAEYYDLFYKDKDYASECNYVDRLIKKAGKHPRSMLDVGCGSGRHSIRFSEMGYEVAGIDASERMIALATANAGSARGGVHNLVFSQQDIRGMDMGVKYDAVVALFHVMSYQTTIDDIHNTLTSISRHMDSGSVFVFDFWYAPAVENLKPGFRMKEYSLDGATIVRKSVPDWKKDERIVEIELDIEVRGGKEAGRKITETHAMRYFDIHEMENLLENCGMESIASYAWMTEEKPTVNNWSACMVAKKV